LQRVDKSKLLYAEEFQKISYGYRAKGDSIIFSLPQVKDKIATRFICGIKRKTEDFKLHVRVSQNNNTSYLNYTVERAGREADISRYIKEIQLQLSSGNKVDKIEFFSTDQIVIVNPMMEYRIVLK